MSKAEFVWRYVQYLVAEAEKELEHTRRVAILLMDRLPDEVPERALDIYTSRSTLLGALRTPEVTASMMADTLRKL